MPFDHSLGSQQPDFLWLERLSLETAGINPDIRPSRPRSRQLGNRQ
jgi:hypothetical protein